MKIKDTTTGLYFCGENKKSNQWCNHSYLATEIKDREKAERIIYFFANRKLVIE